MNKIEKFLQDISLHTEYRFLEAGKDDDELARIAKKRGVKLPAVDLAIFKGKYAFTDRTNLNGCSLPKDEVEKSLDTLVGKAIDFDHFRERIVGYWLDAEVIGDVIYAYGAFFKGNLTEDFDVIKDLMSKNNLGISFEAYGNREFKDDGTYDLKDIEWAGGALLINTKPAFPGAGVLEMANKRVMEFATTMKEPDTYIHKKEAKTIEHAYISAYEMNTVLRLADETICPECGKIGGHNVMSVSFIDNGLTCQCNKCGCLMMVSYTPSVIFALPGEIEEKEETEVSKIKKTVTNVAKCGTKKAGDKTMSKIENAPSTDKAEDMIKSEEEIKVVPDAQVIVEEEAKEIVEEVKDITVDQAIAEAKADIAKEAEATEEDIDCPTCGAKTKKGKVKKTCGSEELEALKTELATLKEQLGKARDEGKLLGERRSILGDFAKDMSDADVLDAVKYENATLKQKVAKLESLKSVEKSSVEEVKLEIGSKDKDKESEIDTLAKNVRKRAFNL